MIPLGGGVPSLSLRIEDTHVKVYCGVLFSAFCACEPARPAVTGEFALGWEDLEETLWRQWQ